MGGTRIPPPVSSRMTARILAPGQQWQRQKMNDSKECGREEDDIKIQVLSSFLSPKEKAADVQLFFVLRSFPPLISLFFALTQWFF